MFDVTAKLFWFRSKEWYAAMADKLADIVFTDDSKETIDVINILLLGWLLLGLVVYIIGNVVAAQLRKRKSLACCSESETPAAAVDTRPCADDIFEEDITPKEEKQVGIPSCKGDDQEFTKWINEVISWIYVESVVSPLIDSWLSALNAHARLASAEYGILVDFLDILPTSGPPKVTEVRQCSKYDLVGGGAVACDMEFGKLGFNVAVSRVGDREASCHPLPPFTLFVSRLLGKVSIECNPQDISFVARYSEPPQIKLHAKVSNEIEIPEEERGLLCRVVSKVASDALWGAVCIARLACFPACPRPVLTPGVGEEEYKGRLLVKVIKATNLGGSTGCSKPYCVVEADNPPQRRETRVAVPACDPFWDEHFTFSIKDETELLFEIYDKDETASESSFLGLGIVGIEELLHHPSQRQIIPLQSRPLEEDHISGALTVEFLFLDWTNLESGRQGSSGDKQAVKTDSRLTPAGTLITTTTIKRMHEGTSVCPPP